MLANRVRMSVAKDDSFSVTAEFNTGNMSTQTLFDFDGMEVFSTSSNTTYELEINKVYTLYLTYSSYGGMFGYGEFVINGVDIYTHYPEMPAPYTKNNIRVLSYNQFGHYSGEFEISFEILSSGDSIEITHYYAN